MSAKRIQIQVSYIISPQHVYIKYVYDNGIIEISPDNSPNSFQNSDILEETEIFVLSDILPRSFMF